MVGPTPMVGRDDEVAALREALAGTREDGGAVVFLRGETGVGKTRLVEQVRADWSGTWRSGSARPGAAPYLPLLEVLGPVPLDEPEAAQQRLVAGLRAIAADGPAVCVLEDLHHADLATLDVVELLARDLTDVPLLVLATYDDTGLVRDHGLRTLRASLRRSRRLHEIKVPPLSVDSVARLLDEIAGPEAAARAQEVHRMTGGLTFFVEEVVRALGSSDPGAWPGESGVPLPESVSDAVLDTTRALRRQCPDAIELAAVLGQVVDLSLLATLVPAPDVDALLETGLLSQRGHDSATFRHPLVGGVLRDSITWARRRERHAQVAAALAAHEAEPAVVAEHWEAAGERARARSSFVAAAERRCAVHAYRDAAALARRALALWPHDDPDRVDVLEGLADCAEKSGDPRAAETVWNEVIDVRRQLADELGVARGYQRLASAAELDGDHPAAVAARATAADCFAAVGDAAAAAGERLALAAHLAGRGQLRAALEHVEEARNLAERAGRPELVAQVLTVEGATRAALGQYDEGTRIARSGLDLALSTRDPDVIGANYYGFAEAMLHATHYDDSADAYRMGAEYCEEQGVDGLGQACLACMCVAVRFRGDWDRALEICRKVLADPSSDEHVRIIAEEEAGLIGVLRGGNRRGQATLRKTLAFGERHGIFGVVVGSAWGLAVAAAAVDGDEAGRAAVGDLLALCEDIDDWNFALPGLRWASSYAATLGDRDQLARCQALLARAATHNSAPKVLSVLAHAGAELAHLDGDPRAAGQFARSVELMGGGASPYEAALVTFRWALALGAASDGGRAADLLVEAYRTARRLGAQPLAQACAASLDELGESADRRLGPAAARDLSATTLTRREQQVLQLVAAGRTNRAIADELVLSVRTVDMHVRNLLSKLDCPSRTAAGRRAEELGLLPV